MGIGWTNQWLCPCLVRSQWNAITAVSGGAFTNKRTVVFKLGGLSVDFTFTNGWHGPTDFSKYMDNAMAENELEVQHGIKVFCGFLRARGWAYRKGRGSVTGQIKNVHWVLMCLTALRSAAPACQWKHKAFVFEFLRQYFAEVDFQKVAFIPGVCTLRED